MYLVVWKVLGEQLLLLLVATKVHLSEAILNFAIHWHLSRWHDIAEVLRAVAAHVGILL